MSMRGCLNQTAVAVVVKATIVRGIMSLSSIEAMEQNGRRMYWAGRRCLPPIGGREVVPPKHCGSLSDEFRDARCNGLFLSGGDQQLWGISLEGEEEILGLIKVKNLSRAHALLRFRACTGNLFAHQDCDLGCHPVLGSPT